MEQALCLGPSCARCLKVCPGDAVGHWSRDWEACDPHRSPHGFPQLSDHVARIIAAPTPEAQKELVRSEDSFNLWQSILRGAGVITGCRKCADVCPVGADYQAMLSDALDAIPELDAREGAARRRDGGGRARRPDARSLCGAAALDRQSAAAGLTRCSPCRNRAPRSGASRRTASGAPSSRRGARRSTPASSTTSISTGSTIRTSGARSRSSPRTCCAASPTAISTTSSASSRTTASRSSGAPAARPARRCSIRAASRTSATPWSASRASINAPAARRADARMCRFRSASTRSGQMLARCATDVGIAVNWAGSGTTTPSVMQIELIDRLKPTIWMGMSSYGLHLANLAEARGLDLAASSVETDPLLGRAAVGCQARQARAPMGRAGARHVRHDRSRHDGRRGCERRRLPHLDRHVLHRGARSRHQRAGRPKARSAASWSRRCGPTTSRRSCAGARATSSPGARRATATGRSRCSRW